MRVAVKAATDLGLRRKQNEDHHAIWFSDAAGKDGRGTLLIVADGMGGARAGEVASHLAVDTVLNSYRASDAGVPESLVRAIEDANQVVHHHSLSHPELRGMGTTCTALVIRGREAFVGHVGDSRAYALRDGEIRQLTRDHSLVAQLVQIQQITPEQARTDPRRNVVTRSVGVGESVEVDAERVADDLKMGDTLLLCTDGLHGLVSDPEIAEIASSPDLERACDQFIELARARGGPDNITLIIARVGPDEISRRA